MTSVLLVTTERLDPATSGIRRRGAAIRAALERGSPTALHVAHERPTRAARAVSAVRALPGRRPLYMAYFPSAAGHDAVARAVRVAAPDIVVALGLGAAAVLDGVVPRARTVLDLADAEPLRFRSLARTGRWHRRGRWWLDAPLAARWFTRHLADFAMVTTVSPDDLEFYRRLAPAARLQLAPNGVEFPLSPRFDPGGAGAVFVGNFEYLPNQDGLQWLAGEVLPRTNRLRTLRVVGRAAAAVHPLVECVGVVDDLSAEWAAATLAVAPIRLGGGTRLKVLEAMAHGVPVVATPVAAAGLGAVPGRDFAVAGSPAAFAEAIDRLVESRAARQTLARAGRRLAARFEWDACLAPFTQLAFDTAPAMSVSNTGLVSS